MIDINKIQVVDWEYLKLVFFHNIDSNFRSGYTLWLVCSMIFNYIVLCCCDGCWVRIWSLLKCFTACCTFFLSHVSNALGSIFTETILSALEWLTNDCFYVSIFVLISGKRLKSKRLSALKTDFINCNKCKFIRLF